MSQIQILMRIEVKPAFEHATCVPDKRDRSTESGRLARAREISEYSSKISIDAYVNLA
ncbi:hypothetical protein OKW43_001843 [Paraburkholderia sp. WC7.3g]|uniref:hypothetical protein n=1 Tax=Paraburkholderia TaxID=1822464 RepID=UPI0016556E80|nr:hypothetical protein [Paraburkholderia podalyriae]